MTTYLALVVMHVVASTLWFAGGLMAGSSLRKALPLGREAFLLAARVNVRGGMLATLGNVLTLGTGVGLIFVRYGGFKALPTNFHVAFGLVLIGTVLGAALLGPTGGKLQRAAESPDWTAEGVRPLIKRAAMGSGINHMLWLAALVLMFLRF